MPRLRIAVGIFAVMLWFISAGNNYAGESTIYVSPGGSDLNRLI